ncbi:16S rRNA (guanine(527)-N(7))-methyltransferase RsmG [Eubacterium sp. MSJ-33]|uniref:16S rRNA (guanine(527)-N(7))-methyltransferase RsmG n=1 Tax=Eubacterium sp. MSJ-33 TaxID=2841528 RepID=UPI001C794FF6|nr:16S rRNA (guanine(527)-N(7))-methyltransferase RsmG [Eubacterium sp. MSJ-33]QWT52273.1 16S rRNA (guanine(527)-N(7))-methyltransferase RsmG [Eubacterium sp. MSJ-33]
MEKIKDYVEQITEGQVLLTDVQLAQFEQYYDRLIEKNKVMNLTAITEREDVILKHFIDSLALARYVKLWEKEYKIIDVGTGAGFPGIPLKIAFPNLQVTLFDSLNKRIKFLQEMIDTLKLKEITAVHGRAEEGARDKNMREKYDFAVSRAVANMAVLSEYCIPFVKVGGYFIPYKTGTVEEEITQGKKAIQILGGKIEKIEKLMLPDSDISRSFVFIKKEKQTPKAYPRKAGTASKQPLGI